VLNAPAERGQVGQRGLSEVEEALEEGGQANLFFRGNRDGSLERVDDHAGVDDSLRGKLALVVAEAEAELVREAVPAGLGAPGRTGGAGADRAATDQSGAGRVGRSFGGEDSVVHSDGGVKRRVVEAPALLRHGVVLKGGRGRSRRAAGVSPPGGRRARRAKKRWMHRMRTLRGEPALRWPK